VDRIELIDGRRAKPLCDLRPPCVAHWSPRGANPCTLDGREDHGCDDERLLVCVWRYWICGCVHRSLRCGCWDASKTGDGGSGARPRHHRHYTADYHRNDDEHHDGRHGQLRREDRSDTERPPEPLGDTTSMTTGTPGRTAVGRTTGRRRQRPGADHDQRDHNRIDDGDRTDAIHRPAVLGRFAPRRYGACGGGRATTGPTCCIASTCNLFQHVTTVRLVIV